MEFGRFNWVANPFIFKIDPSLFVGYTEESSTVSDGLSGGSKFMLVLGPTGSGKTTLLKSLKSKMNGGRIIYLPKPPNDPKDWVDVFSGMTKSSLISRLFRKSEINLFDLADNLNQSLDGKRCTLFVDECHEASLESLEWLRTLTDQVENLQTVLAGLPVFDSMLTENLETFQRRITERVELRALDRSETRELIKRRIESCGGDDIKPFTSETIEYIYERTGGFPRDILKTCNDLIREAGRRGITTIDPSFITDSSGVRQVEEGRVDLEKVEELPEKQRQIIDMLSNGPMNPSQLALAVESSYASKDNAIRSVNNLLRRLMAERMVERKKSGKTYKYILSPRLKTMMVEA